MALSLSLQRRHATMLLCALLAGTTNGLSSPQAAQAATTVAVAAAQQATLKDAKDAYDKGDIGKALPLFQKVADTNPGSDDAHLWLAKALMKQGGEDNYAKAKTHLIQALSVNPDNAEALIQLGTITGWDPARRDQAIAMLKHALELKAESTLVQQQEADITRNLVQLLVWNGDYTQAAQYAQPMRQAFATETKWQALYANLLAHLNQNADAIALYEGYVKPFEQPANTEVLQWRMDYLYALRFGDQSAKARQLFDELYPTVMARKEDNLLNSLAGIGYDLGKYPESFAASQAMSATVRTQRDVRLREARTLAKLQQWPQTITLFDGLYREGALNAEETLEFADVFAGQQLPPNAFPQPGYVANLYQGVATNPKYAHDEDLQLRIARFNAGMGGAQPGPGETSFSASSPTSAGASTTAINSYMQAVRRTKGGQAAIDELIGYLMSHKGPQSQQAMGQLAKEYPQNIKVQGAYAQMLTWDEATRPQGIRQLIQLAKTDTRNRGQWLEALDEVLGWQSPTPALQAEYNAILAIDPTHPAAQTAIRAITPQLPAMTSTQTTTTFSTAVAPNPAATMNTPMGAQANNMGIGTPANVTRSSYGTQTGTPWTTERSVMIQGNKNAPQKVYGYDHSADPTSAAGLPMAGTNAAHNRVTTVNLPSVNPATGMVTPGTATTYETYSSATTTTPSYSQPYAPQTHAGVPNANYSGSYKEWGSSYQQPGAARTAVTTPVVPARTIGNPGQNATPYGTESFLNNGYGDAPAAMPKAYATTQPQQYTGLPQHTGAVGERYTFNNNGTLMASSQPPYQPKQIAQSQVGTPPWQAGAPESMQARIERAKQLTYDRNYTDAFELFDEVLKLDPANRDARLGKGYALLWSGRKLSAKRMLEQLMADYPNDIEVITAMAEVHKMMGRNDKALELLRDVRNRTGDAGAAEKLANAPLVWDFAPVNANVLTDWALVSANYTQEPDMETIQRELDALNAALENVQAVQAQSAAQLDEMNTDLYETKQAINSPVTEFQANPNAALQAPMQQYFGQTMMAYDDPTHQGSPQDAQPLAPYLEDRISNLENTLFDDMRPELRAGFMWQTQDGNANTNKMSTWGVPNQVSFSLLPQLRLRGGVIPQRYYLPDATVRPRSNSGLLYTAGFTAKPWDRLTLDGDFGLVRFGQSDTTNINYRAVATFDPWDRVRLKIGSRRLTLANSLLSISGFKPSTGAFAGEKLGPANETSVFGELNLVPFSNVDVNVAYEFAGVTSRGDSPTSYKNQVYASAGYTHRFNDKHWARLGYQFLYMGFSKNTINGYYDVTNFGATQPVVAMSPTVLADPGYEFGGYFSPKSFFLNAVRLDYHGSLFDRFVEYQLGGSVGIQSFSHGHGIRDSSPTGLAYSADAAVRLNFTDWLATYGRFSLLDSGGSFSRYRFEGGVIIRPYIEALSPIIGQKMPKSGDYRKRDSQFPFVYDIFQHYY